MKKSALLVVLAVMLPSKGDAQYYRRCSEPYEPNVPTGYYEEQWRMESAQSEVEQYLIEVEDYRECLARNHEQAGEDAQRVTDEWDAAVRAYNSR